MPIANELANSQRVAPSFPRNGLEWESSASFDGDVKEPFIYYEWGLWFSTQEIIGRFVKRMSEVEEPLAKAIGGEIYAPGMQIEVSPVWGLLKWLFLENQDTKGEDYHLFQGLTDVLQDNDYVKQNAIDMGIQLMSLQEEQPTSRNIIGRQFRNIMSQIEELNNRYRPIGQKTANLEES